MRKINFNFIPPHLNCTNCGECCGPLVISKKESDKIYKYCLDNDVCINNPKVLSQSLKCPFRDEENKKCLIYPVRPELCRVFGVIEGMECINGNTYKLDGLNYIKDMNKNLDNYLELVQDIYDLTILNNMEK